LAATFGIEEEFLLVDRGTGELAPRADEVLEGAHRLVGDQVTSELSRCQVESNSSTCSDLEQAAAELTRLRTALAKAGVAVGVAPVALASHPWSGWHDQELNLDKEHYRALVNLYQDVARRQVICGCHIHVGVDDPDDRITVMNRVRPWLPALLALSANSPWWQGTDTGYASYRTMLWREWPTAEVQPILRDYSEYERLVGTLQQVGAIDAPSALYWYVRPSAQLPTVEYRVCDVSLRIDDAVTIAGLVRALTATLLAQRADDLAEIPAAVLGTGIWRAARFGLEGELIDPRSLTLVPAHEAIAQLLDLVDSALRAAGDHERVTNGVSAILRRGNGAVAQRGALARFPERSQVLQAIGAMGVLDDAQQ
jgi:carboxylate-amine ligase